MILELLVYSRRPSFLQLPLRFDWALFVSFLLRNSLYAFFQILLIIKQDFLIILVSRKI